MWMDDGRLTILLLKSAKEHLIGFGILWITDQNSKVLLEKYEMNYKQWMGMPNGSEGTFIWNMRAEKLWKLYQDIFVY